MRHSVHWLAALLIPVLAGGCAAHGYESIYAEARYGYGSHRADAYYYGRAEQDVRYYVAYLDRHLGLSNRQEQRIRRLLFDRVYALLDRTRPQEHRYVYPFPRRFERKPDRRTERWWYETDRAIEARLTRRQIYEYRALTRGDRGYDYRDRRDDPYDRPYRRS